jgi:hypothetical protein
MFNDAKTYCEETHIEWEQVNKVLAKYPEDFSGYTKELFFQMYNYSCTRCFGWSMPDTMMVPLADFMNHLPVDTQFGIYSKE